MEAGDFLGHVEVLIDLMEVAADAQEHFARVDGREVIVLHGIVAREEVLDAVRLGPEFAAIEDVYVIFLGGGLKTADEMAGQADTGNGQLEASREQKIDKAKVDGIAGAAVHDAVQVTVLRVVIILFVAVKAQHIENVFVECGQNVFGLAARVDAFAQFAGVAVEERGVGLKVDVGILSLGEQPRALFEVEVAAFGEAKGEEAVIGDLAGEVLDDFLRAPAQGGFAAQGVRTQPVRRAAAAGKDFLANGLVNDGAFVVEEGNQGRLLAFRERNGRLDGGSRTHG